MSGRGSLNEAEFRRVADYLAADPDDGPALFAAKGVDVIDNPAAARRFADVCLNSFAGHTLVVLADGTRVPIADIGVGVSVAAFDVDAGVVTAGAVTAVLSHGDELFDVGLADGSVLSVTDDHRFWDPFNTVWSPIGDLADSGGSVLGLDGANIAVTGIDDGTGVSPTVWDISVAGVHNFYVAADASSVPVLVHNASDFCPLPISLAQFDALASITDPVQAAAFADALDAFSRIAADNGLGAEGFEGMVRAFVERLPSGRSCVRCDGARRR